MAVTFEPDNPTTPTPYFEIEEAARYARVSISTVRRWLASGVLRRCRAGGSRRVLIAKDDLDRAVRGEMG
jgi:excisionase family DNA binding protein